MNEFLSLIAFYSTISLSLVHANYFYGGSITARPLFDAGNSSRTVVLEFTTRFAYRRNYSESTYCDDSIVQDGSILIGQGMKLLCDKNCLNEHEVVGNSLVYCNVDFKSFIYNYDLFLI
jgi:hypothetical protein